MPGQKIITDTLELQTKQAERLTNLPERVDHPTELGTNLLEHHTNLTEQ